MVEHNEETLLAFIDDVERSMFRTDMDTGANTNALIVWNQLRMYAGLPALSRTDLTKRHLATAVEDLVQILKTPFPTPEEQDKAISRKQKDIYDLALCVAEGVPMGDKIRKAKEDFLRGS